jgi:two-component system, cell cycle sensor histidine kinase and response regulator CckA
VDVNRRILGLAPLLRRMLGGRLQLFLEAVEPMPPIRMDPLRFDSVLIDLAINASAAAPAGRAGIVSLGTRIQESGVVERWGAGGETQVIREVVIGLWETSQGWARPVLERTFDPTSEGASCSFPGLGSATAAGLVRAVGGRVEVDCIPGVGSAFRIFLPEAPPSSRR